jgi:hypothetical protein
VVEDAAGCTTYCTVEVEEECPSDEFCTFTQGFYGNPGGYKNGVGTEAIIKTLLEPPYPVLVIGELGTRSITFAIGSEECIIKRLPGGGPADTLPDFGDQVITDPSCQTTPELSTNGQGRLRNVLLSQTIALSLNVRYDGFLHTLDLCRYMSSLAVDCGDDGCCGHPPICIEDDDEAIPDTYYDVEIPQSVFDELDELGWGYEVSDLLALANRALAGYPLTHTSLSDISSAADAINNLFDNCRFLNHCGEDPRPTALTSWGRTTTAKIANVPAEFGLDQNYPNPFNAGTQITYGLAEDANVDLAIYNILGQRVVTLESGHREAGYHTVAWDGRDRNGDEVASGMYFYRIKAGDLVTSKKMILLK